MVIVVFMAGSRQSGLLLRLTLLLALLLAASCPPAGAAGNDTPLSPSEIAIRQSHMAWIAFERETEMNAAIAYITPLYSTDMTRMNALLAEFKAEEALIPSTTTRAGFAAISDRMRKIVKEFRGETTTQMTAGYGKTEELAIQIRKATTNNPYITQKEASYWSTRRTLQLADFDAWERDAQQKLDTLKKNGFDTENAQRTLDVFVSKRPALVSALDAKSEDRISSVNSVTYPLSEQLVEQVAETQEQVSDEERMQFLVEQGYRATYRADATNAELIKILLDLGPVETTTRTLKLDLAESRRILSTGNLALAKTPLTRVKKDLKDLSMEYRDIANTADLPPALTSSLRVLVLTLDTTADGMEAAP